MIFPVTIKDKDGKVKQVLSVDQLKRKHWGEGSKCSVCNAIWFSEIRRGSQSIFIQELGNRPVKVPKGKKPQGNECSTLCRNVANARRKRLANPIKIVMRLCKECGTEFPRNSKGHKFCKLECGDKYRARKAIAHTAELTRQRNEKRRNETRTATCSENGK